jgi:hypothetical protein
MGKVAYYIARTVQASGLGLVLYAWIVSILQDSSMNVLFSFTAAGMGIFMAGWMIQKLF